MALICRRAARSSECYTKKSSCTAEHTAALHEMFAKPVPCRDKTKSLLTLRQWLTDFKELRAASSPPSQETAMQSLKTVTGSTRDFNNVDEITDLLAPNNLGKLHSAIERTVAGSAVMDADTRLSDSSGGAGKRAKGDHKGANSATFPCKRHAKGTCARGDKCRFSHKGSEAKSSGKGGKGRKAHNARDRCQSAERSRIHRSGQSRVSRLSLCLKQRHLVFLSPRTTV